MSVGTAVEVIQGFVSTMGITSAVRIILVLKAQWN